MAKNWVFHFRNMDHTPTWWGVYHKGCGESPMHDGRFGCYKKTVDHNPTGGTKNDVYNPSDWVVDFGQWWDLIRDAMELIGTGIALIAIPGGTVGGLKDALEEAFHVGTDIATIDQWLKSHPDPWNAIHTSAHKSAMAVGATVEQIRGFAVEMGLGASGWVFLAGVPFWNFVHADNKYNNNGGYSVLCNPHGSLHRINNVIANHAFISGGQMYFYWNSTYYWHFSNWTGPVDEVMRKYMVLKNMAALNQNAAQPYPSTLGLWLNEPYEPL